MLFDSFFYRMRNISSFVAANFFLNSTMETFVIEDEAQQRRITSLAEDCGIQIGVARFYLNTYNLHMAQQPNPIGNNEILTDWSAMTSEYRLIFNWSTITYRSYRKAWWICANSHFWFPRPRKSVSMH